MHDIASSPDRGRTDGLARHGSAKIADCQNVPRTVEFLDMYPTLVEMCGLTGTPVNLHGKGVVPLLELENPKASWSKPAISQVRRGTTEDMIDGHSLRNDRYRYTMWKGGELGEKPYDYETDAPRA